MEKMHRIKEGDWVKVSAGHGVLPGTTRTGVVEILKPPYARVKVTQPESHELRRMVFTVDQLEPLKGGS